MKYTPWLLPRNCYCSIVPTRNTVPWTPRSLWRDMIDQVLFESTVYIVLIAYACLETRKVQLLVPLRR